MKTFAKTPLALAITALLAAPYALAGGDNEFDTDAYLDVDVENDITAEITHKVNNDIDVDLTLETEVYDPDHFSAATVDRKQFSDDNTLYDDLSQNTTQATNSGNDAQGNIGVNMASGGLNSQANDAAISKGSDGTTTVSGKIGPFPYEKEYESMVFAKAATISVQSASGNNFDNDGTVNATGANDSFNNASGNVGVNMASGFGNGQNNGMTLAVGQNSSAEATVAGVQAVYDNELDNDLYCGCSPNTNTSSLTNSFNNASGNVGVNIASGNINLQSNTLSIARAK